MDVHHSASIKGPGNSSIILVDLFVLKIKIRERERERAATVNLDKEESIRIHSGRKYRL